MDKIHTTILGLKRINKNLNLNLKNVDEIIFLIKNDGAKVLLNGKNYYVYIYDFVLTINKDTYSIITAPLLENKNSRKYNRN